MPSPFVPSGFNDPSIGFNDPSVGFNGTGGPPATPVVDTISPNSGSTLGGDTVTITGTSLASAIAVTIAGTAQTIDSNTDTQIVITTVAHAAGTFNLKVQTAGGTSAAGTTFQYTVVGPPGAPVITAAVSPGAGPLTGGTLVSIPCTNGATVNAVYFDTTPAVSFTRTSTLVTAVAPAHAPGQVDITLRNPSGTSGITPFDQFIFRPPTPPSTRKWQILVRDGSYTPVGEVEDFSGLTFIDRYNDVGAFTLTVQAGTAIARLLLAPQSGIVVLEDDEVVFSGPVRDRLRQSQGGLEQIVVSGVNDMFWLQARLGHPQPATASPPYSTSAFDTFHGQCSAALNHYVLVNLGINAIPRRRIPTLTVAPDPGIGSTVTANARWQQLLGFFQQLTLQSTPPIGFRVAQSGQALVFSCFAPRDRSGSAIFQAVTGTLGDFDYEQVGSIANYVYAGGTGALQNRLIAEAEDGTDISEWGLVEEFLQAADQGTTSGLTQAAAGEIVAQTGTFRLDLTVIDTAGLAWRTGYNVGDIVSVIVDGVQLTELVRAVQVDLGPNGDTESIVPSVSSPSPKLTVREQQLFSIVRNMQARIADLERNQ